MGTLALKKTVAVKRIGELGGIPGVLSKNAIGAR